MKNLIFAAMMSLSFSAAAADVPNFSAFVDQGNLVVTIIGDECNGFGGQLDVEETCKATRATRNLALECDATLTVVSTAMFCPGKKPVVLELDLKAANVAPEAQVLNLTYGTQTIRVQVK